MAIQFYENDIRVSVLKRQSTRDNLMKVVHSLGYKGAEINYIFCSDDTLIEINRRYLAHDTYTDIITFDYTKMEYSDGKNAALVSPSDRSEILDSRDDPRGNFSVDSPEISDEQFMSLMQDQLASEMRDEFGLVGDIYISYDRVKENAKLFHVKHVDELNRVLIHGILHLAGYKDKTPEEEKKMHEMEDLMLETCFDGYKK